MMMKRRFFTLSLFFGAFFYSLACAETLEQLTPEAFSDPRQPPVPFFHDEHNENAGLDEDCSLCHHVYRDGHRVPDESSEDISCAECHPPVHFSRVTSLAAAYHKCCKGCHLSLQQGPIVCGQCHQNEE